jgi:excisionase family DNA binding protein
LWRGPDCQSVASLSDRQIGRKKVPICSGFSFWLPYRLRVTGTINPTPSLAVVADVQSLADALAERLAEQAAALDSQQEPYWTAEQAAAYIAADKQRIYDLRSQGRLHCVKDGSRLLTRRSWLDAYLEGNG